MSSGMMNTEPGGESTQYESIQTVTKPHSKEGGQMGEPETVTQDTTRTDADDAERGAKTAENIRYGQGISEGGMGGQTTTSGGCANVESGYGATDSAQTGDGSAESETAESRDTTGYGGKQDMDETVGG